MTTPDISDIIPLKYKTWVTLIGGILTVVGPFIISAGEYLSQPWPLLIGLVFALLTALGVYKAPYKPPGTVLAPDTEAVEEASVAAGAIDPSPADYPGTYRNPWK